MTSRAAQRQHLSSDMRHLLTENDLDTLDGEFREFKSTVGRLQAILFGILVSTTTGSIIGMITLVAR